MNNIKNMQASQEFTDALTHCIDLLRQNNYITSLNNDVISRRSALFGQYMYEYLMQCRFVWMYQRPQVQEEPVEFSTQSSQEDSTQSTTVHELSGATLTNSEIDQLLSNTEVNSSNSNEFYYTIKIDQLPMSNNEEKTEEIVNERAIVPFIKSAGLKKGKKSFQSSPENSINLTPRMSPKPLTRKRYSMSSINSSKATEDLNKTSNDNNNNNSNESVLNESQKPSGKKKVVSLEEKQKVVELAQANPTWSLELLQKHGSPKLQTLTQLRTWQRQINKGASTRDNFHMIERWTYANYSDAVKHQRKITKKMIREWAVQAGTLFLDARTKKTFKASGIWISTFMKKYNVQIAGKRGKKSVDMIDVQEE